MAVGNHGDELSAPLNQLHVAGAIDLPHLAELYGVLKKHVSNTSDGESTALMRGGIGGSSSMGLIQPAWSTLRNEAIQAFQKLSDNVDDAAGVMMHIFHAYAHTDAEAASNLKTLWDGVTNTTDKAYLPPK